MFCMSCGTELPVTARFCLSCGAKTMTVEQEEAEKNLIELMNSEGFMETVVDNLLKPIEESVDFYTERAKSGNVTNEIVNNAVELLASVSKLSNNPQKNRFSLALRVYEDAQRACIWYSEWMRKDTYGYNLSSHLKGFMSAGLQSLLEKSGFDSAVTSRIATSPGILHWLEGYVLTMIFMDFMRRKRWQEITKSELLALFIRYGDVFVQEQLALADEANRYYIGNGTNKEAIDRFTLAMNAEVTEERKEQIQSSILDAVIDGLKNGLVTEAELPVIADLTLKKMDPMTYEYELIIFSSTLKRKWQIFRNLSIV